MSLGESLRSKYMYGLPTARVPSSTFATSLSQAYSLHYQSFLAFQQQAMVMSQMLHERRRRSQSPDSTLQPFAVPLPPYFNFSPTDDHRLQLPSTFPELDDYSSPLFLRAQSDQGYSSDSRSKSSRLSIGSETSEKSRFLRVSPDSMRSKPSRTPSILDENSRSSDGFIQAPEVSSSVIESGLCPAILLDEDSRKNVSKFLPSFCDETSNQGVPECDIEIKIEPEDPSYPPASPVPGDATNFRCNSDSETDFENVKEEVESPVKFLNSDVMWSVKPDAMSKSQPAFVPSPDKSSNDCASEINTYHTSYLGTFGRIPMQGTVPSIASFTPLESRRQVKPKQVKQTKKDATKTDSVPSTQTEAMDLSVPKKRKAKTPIKENTKKRHKKDSATKRSSAKQVKQEVTQKEAVIDEKRIWVRDPKHVLQVCKRLNIQPRLYVKEPKEETQTEKTKPKEVKQVKQVKKEKNTKAKGAKQSKVKQEQAEQNVVKQDKEKKFPCSVCDKCYSQRSSLHTHMRIHTGVRPYECKDCGRTFTDCSTYIKHCRLHTGEKPYACGVCGRCFTQSGNMMRHQAKCRIKT